MASRDQTLLATRYSQFAKCPSPLRLVVRRRRRRAGAAEEQAARVAVDALHHLVDLGERAPAVGGEPLPFAQPVVGEARESGRDLGGACVEVLGRRLDGARRLGDVARLIGAAAKQALGACKDVLDALRATGKRL